jgi:predicted Zn-dependent protease
MLLTRDAAENILKKVLSYSKADEAEASLDGNASGNLRFARNMPTTTGRSENLSLSYTAVFGKRVGTVTTTDIDDDGLKRAVRRAEELAQLAPERPEYMPRLGPQSYLTSPAWDPSVARLSPTDRAEIAAHAIAEASSQNLHAAGYIENGESFQAQANTRGLFAFHLSTSIDYTLTARHEDGNGSGWGAASSHRRQGIDEASVTHRAVRKAIASENPTELPPGTYPVVLEPSAAGDMLNLFVGNLGRRSADEGRSYFSDPKKGTKIGEQLFGPDVTIYSDPTHPIVPSTPWGDDALPLERTVWVDHGTLKALSVGRFWAEKKGLSPLPSGSNIIMEGGTGGVDDLVAATEYGLLVTSFWYIRTVDPRTILHTGLTRDGLFLIEKGKIVRPVVNFRWNESPAALFKTIELLGKPERAVTREGNRPMLVPPIKAREFHFTSVSPST